MTIREVVEEVSQIDIIGSQMDRIYSGCYKNLFTKFMRHNVAAKFVPRLSDHMREDVSDFSSNSNFEFNSISTPLPTPVWN